MLGLMERDDTVTDQLQTISAALRGRLPEMCQAVTDRILERIPLLRDDDAMVDLLTVSVESNVTTAVHVLGFQIDAEQVEAPAAALEYARRLAQRGVPIGDLLRAYRIGQASFMQWCYRELADQAGDGPTDMSAVMTLTENIFDYVDQVSEHVLIAYTRERDRWVRNGAAVRAAQVRSLLEGGPIDINHVESVLGYRLNQHHVGILAWSDEPAHGEGGTLVELERLAGRLADHVSKGSRALFVARDETSAFVWLPLGSEEALGTDAFDDLVPALDWSVHLALGEPTKGPNGFRVTMREALRVHTVAVMAGSVATNITRYSKIAPVALLTEDLERARDWVISSLGPLAVDDEATARLRETLLVFFSTGGSYVETAERLTLHKNTVHYRVRKAEEVRGRPIGNDRLDLELALLACRWLRSAVLMPPP
jgi:PucR C-terminal helix-turn-helix domain/GGDEF-like domain